MCTSRVRVLRKKVLCLCLAARVVTVWRCGRFLARGRPDQACILEGALAAAARALLRWTGHRELFSHFRVLRNHSGGLGEHTFPGPPPRVSEVVFLWDGPTNFYFSPVPRRRCPCCSCYFWGQGEPQSTTPVLEVTVPCVKRLALKEKEPEEDRYFPAQAGALPSSVEACCLECVWWSTPVRFTDQQAALASPGAFYVCKILSPTLDFGIRLS